MTRFIFIFYVDVEENTKLKKCIFAISKSECYHIAQIKNYTLYLNFIIK